MPGADDATSVGAFAIVASNDLAASAAFCKQMEMVRVSGRVPTWRRSVVSPCARPDRCALNAMNRL